MAGKFTVLDHFSGKHLLVKGPCAINGENYDEIFSLS